MTTDILTPGVDWLEVVRRKSREEFAKAFVKRPILEALILRSPRTGVDAINAYFDTSRRLFDQIAFVREARAPERVFLEWEGQFRKKAISGVTILSLANNGFIARIRIYHFPQEQADVFAAAFESEDRSS
jgi:hypothetical protein